MDDGFRDDVSGSGDGSVVSGDEGGEEVVDKAGEDDAGTRKRREEGGGELECLVWSQVEEW